jgi:hypothetical protein
MNRPLESGLDSHGDLDNGGREAVSRARTGRLRSRPPRSEAHCVVHAGPTARGVVRLPGRLARWLASYELGSDEKIRRVTGAK